MSTKFPHALHRPLRPAPDIGNFRAWPHGQVTSIVIMPPHATPWQNVFKRKGSSRARRTETTPAAAEGRAGGAAAVPAALPSLGAPVALGPQVPHTQTAKFLRDLISLVVIDDLAAGAGGQGLVDAVPHPGGDVVYPPAVLGHVQRIPGAWVERPSVDRLLDEPHRAVGEGEVGAAGVVARRRRRVGRE